jgi:GNAT superfamily N-acetyltransferase
LIGREKLIAGDFGQALRQETLVAQPPLRIGIGVAPSRNQFTNNVAPTPLKSGLANNLALDFIPHPGGGDDLFTLFSNGDLGKGLAKHPIPLMLLARLAIATSRQGKGLGSGLLKDAMLRTLQAADIAGIRAMAVHAKDDDVRAFYERFGFAPAPTDPYHLFVLIKDVRAILK